MEDNHDFFNRTLQGWVSFGRIATLEYHYHPRVLIYHRGKVKLYHYQPKVKKPLSTPLLIVFATVNRPEILDLYAEHSFIGGLLESGVDVYLLDWGYPSSEDSNIALSDYIADYLPHCVQFICAKIRRKQINLLGICQGGLICLCYATLSAQIKNLILISTPVEFNTADNSIARCLKHINMDTLTSHSGNIPGSWLTQFFISQQPVELIGKKYLRFVDNVFDQTHTDKFLRVEKWLYDAPDQTAASFRELIIYFYKKNALVKTEYVVNNQPIDLANLKIPVLNVMASEDEIIPVSASKGLEKYIGSNDYTQQIYPSGHIGIYISNKVGKHLPQAIATWLQQRNQTKSKGRDKYAL